MRVPARPSCLAKVVSDDFPVFHWCHDARPRYVTTSRERVMAEKAALGNKEVISAVPAPFLQESALQIRNLDSPARKLQTRSA